jgi:hypothetical protein
MYKMVTIAPLSELVLKLKCGGACYSASDPHCMLRKYHLWVLCCVDSFWWFFLTCFANIRVTPLKGKQTSFMVFLMKIYSYVLSFTMVSKIHVKVFRASVTLLTKSEFSSIFFPESNQEWATGREVLFWGGELALFQSQTVLPAPSLTFTWTLYSFDTWPKHSLPHQFFLLIPKTQRCKSQRTLLQSWHPINW